MALLAALLSGRKCGNSGPWKLTFPSKHAGVLERLSRDPKPGRLLMSRPHSPTGKDPVVMVSSRINFPRGSSFKGEVMSCTWRASFPTLVAPMSHLAASRPGVALSLSLSLHYRGFPWTGGEATPVPSSMSCCPSWLHSCGLGPAAIAVLRAWTCHLSPGCHT